MICISVEPSTFAVASSNELKRFVVCVTRSEHHGLSRLATVSLHKVVVFTLNKRGIMPTLVVGQQSRFTCRGIEGPRQVCAGSSHTPAARSCVLAHCYHQHILLLVFQGPCELWLTTPRGRARRRWRGWGGGAPEDAPQTISLYEIHW